MFLLSSRPPSPNTHRGCSSVLSSLADHHPIRERDGHGVSVAVDQLAGFIRPGQCRWIKSDKRRLWDWDDVVWRGASAKKLLCPYTQRIERCWVWAFTFAHH